MNLQQISDAVNSYIHRDDPQTLANVSTAIAFAQSEIARSFKPREAYEITLLTAVNGAAPLPSDFGSADAVLTAQGDLGYKAPREFATLAMQGGGQGLYTITGSQLLVDPALTEVRLCYYAKPAPLVAATDTNWLSDSYPDVLTWFAIAEQHRFVQDWDQASVAEGHGADVAGRAAAVSKRDEHSGGRLNMRSN